MLRAFIFQLRILWDKNSPSVPLIFTMEPWPCSSTYFLKTITHSHFLWKDLSTGIKIFAHVNLAIFGIIGVIIGVICVFEINHLHIGINWQIKYLIFYVKKIVLYFQNHYYTPRPSIPDHGSLAQCPGCFTVYPE